MRYGQTETKGPMFLMLSGFGDCTVNNTCMAGTWTAASGSLNHRCDVGHESNLHNLTYTTCSKHSPRVTTSMDSRAGSRYRLRRGLQGSAYPQRRCLAPKICNEHRRRQVAFLEGVGHCPQLCFMTDSGPAVRRLLRRSLLVPRFSSRHTHHSQHRASASLLDRRMAYTDAALTAPAATTRAHSRREPSDVRNDQPVAEVELGLVEQVAVLALPFAGSQVST